MPEEGVGEEAANESANCDSRKAGEIRQPKQRLSHFMNGIGKITTIATLFFGVMKSCMVDREDAVTVPHQCGVGNSSCCLDGMLLIAGQETA
jgi:hypothetical protein